MKMRRFELVLLLFAAAAVLFTAGFLTGRHTGRPRVYVTGPSVTSTERSVPAEALSPVDPIDLNSADETLLMTLPGIGPDLAASIIEYRAEHGAFRAVSELMNVRGIGEATYRALLPLVTTSVSVSSGRTEDQHSEQGGQFP